MFLIIVPTVLVNEYELEYYGLITFFVMWSSHAIRIRADVAGASNLKSGEAPVSARAARIASFIAKKAADAKNRGGSPTACNKGFFSKR